MSTMSPVPKDHPLMLAWEVHKKTEEYANSRNWAANPQHVDGSLWALFSAGWQAAQPAQSVSVSDTDIADWADRHDLSFGGSKTDARDAFEDARTFTAALQEKSNG